MVIRIGLEPTTFWLSRTLRNFRKLLEDSVNVDISTAEKRFLIFHYNPILADFGGWGIPLSPNYPLLLVIKKVPLQTYQERVFIVLERKLGLYKVTQFILLLCLSVVWPILYLLSGSLALSEFSPIHTPVYGNPCFSSIWGGWF